MREWRNQLFDERELSWYQWRYAADQNSSRLPYQAIKKPPLYKSMAGYAGRYGMLAGHCSAAGTVEKIVEESDATEAECVATAQSGIYCFEAR